MSKFQVFDRCDAIRHDVALLAKRLRTARVERSLSPQDLAGQAGVSEEQVRRIERRESVLLMAGMGRALRKNLESCGGALRTLQEHTQRLWRKHANVTRAYPADLRLPAKKEILTDPGLW